MEEQPSTQQKQTSLPMGLIAVVLIVVLGIGIYTYRSTISSNESIDQSPKPMIKKTEPTSTSTGSTIVYKNGTYMADGTYTSPAGEEMIGVKITVKDDVIVEASVVGKATKPKSINFQNKFIGGFKELVVGKKIDEVKLDKVAGSSLTPKGFNDAIEKIKAEAAV